jgi:hypothetical protein
MHETLAMTPHLSTVLNTILVLIAGSPFGPAAMTAVAEKWRGRPVPIQPRPPVARPGSSTFDR